MANFFLQICENLDNWSKKSAHKSKTFSWFFFQNFANLSSKNYTDRKLGFSSIPLNLGHTNRKREKKHKLLITKEERNLKNE